MKLRGNKNKGLLWWRQAVEQCISKQIFLGERGWQTVPRGSGEAALA